MADPLIHYARELVQQQDDQDARHDEAMAAFAELDLVDQLAGLRYLVELLKRRYQEPGA